MKMATAMLEEKVEQIERSSQEGFPDSRDPDYRVLLKLRQLNERAYDAEVPKLEEIPLLSNPEKHLKEDHLKLLRAEGRTEEDIRIIAIVEVMSPLLTRTIDKCYGPKREFLKDYNTKQLNWIGSAIYLESERAGKSVDIPVVMDKYLRRGTPIKFRAYYCLKNPEKVERIPNPDSGIVHLKAHRMIELVRPVIFAPAY